MVEARAENLPPTPAQWPDAVALSVELLRAVRAGQGAAEFDALARLPISELRRSLVSDAEKLAFWINVYNAGIQHALAHAPRQHRLRLKFFAKAGVRVAGRKLTFNAVEHGLLRRSSFAFTLGYLSNPFPSRFERTFRVERKDPRVHFALNCGAASCPPIAVYEPERIDAQLDLAARSYLEPTTVYNRAENGVTVSRLFLWFRGDFGGPDGVRELLERYGLIPAGSAPRLRYAPYDWTLALGRYAPD